MRDVLMLFVLVIVLVASSSDSAAHGRRSFRGRGYGASPTYGVPAYGGYYSQGRFSSSDPYSIHFRHPQPQQFGRWDLYFNMHGAPRGIGF